MGPRRRVWLALGREAAELARARVQVQELAPVEDLGLGRAQELAPVQELALAQGLGRVQELAPVEAVAGAERQTPREQALSSKMSAAEAWWRPSDRYPPYLRVKR